MYLIGWYIYLPTFELTYSIAWNLVLFMFSAFQFHTVLTVVTYINVHNSPWLAYDGNRQIPGTDPMPSGTKLSDKQRQDIIDNQHKFPSVIAKELKIAPITVRRVLKQLERDKESSATGSCR